MLETKWLNRMNSSGDNWFLMLWKELKEDYFVGKQQIKMSKDKMFLERTLNIINTLWANYNWRSLLEMYIFLYLGCQEYDPKDINIVEKTSWSKEDSEGQKIKEREERITKWLIFIIKWSRQWWPETIDVIRSSRINKDRRIKAITSTILIKKIR